MPLRDHYRPPVSKKSSWEGFHAMWPTAIVQQLRKLLPPGYVAEPRVQLGTVMEIVAFETDPEEYEYAVHIFDLERERQLVAAIEIVSPANKDRPESRESFVAKCAALLRKGVAVSIVDLVTIRHFNLYAQLMVFIGHPDRSMSLDEPSIYAASCRWPTHGTRALLETWPRALVIGQPLPTLPLWLGPESVVALDLEPSYEQACNDLWIT